MAPFSQTSYFEKFKRIFLKKLPWSTPEELRKTIAEIGSKNKWGSSTNYLFRRLDTFRLAFNRYNLFLIENRESGLELRAVPNMPGELGVYATKLIKLDTELSIVGFRVDQPFKLNSLVQGTIKDVATLDGPLYFVNSSCSPNCKIYATFDESQRYSYSQLS